MRHRPIAMVQLNGNRHCPCILSVGLNALDPADANRYMEVLILTSEARHIRCATAGPQTTLKRADLAQDDIIDGIARRSTM